jgi:histidinol-phosphate aminotransferase
MLRPRAHLVDITRTGQSWGSRADILRLDMNELVPDLGQAAFSAIVARMRPSTFSAYPEVNALYCKLAAHLGKKVENIVLTSGSDAGIRQTIETFCDPGDEMLIVHPTYGMYEVYARIFNLTCSRVACRPDFAVDIGELMRSLDRDIKLLAIANPNGVLGLKIQPAALEPVIRKASERGTTVLLDEAYVEFNDDGWGNRIDEFDNLVLARTFSKAGGLAGLRIGYLLSNEIMRGWLYRVKPVVETNTIAILAADYLLDHPEVMAGFVTGTDLGRTYLSSTLTGLGFEVHPGHANFVLVDFGAHRAAIVAELQRRRIVVRDYGGDDFWSRFTRITLGDPTVMSLVVDAVECAVAQDAVRAPIISEVAS